MKVPGRVIVLFSVLIVMLGCAASGDKASNILKKEAGENVIHDRFTIKPSRSYEECVELRPGMVFDYDFDASDFVNFNIHYHGEHKLHMPVDKRGVMFGEGMVDPATHDFYTEEQEFYCLMWENVGDEPVKVSFRCVIKNK